MQSLIYMIGELRNYVVKWVMSMLVILVDVLTNMILSMRQACDNAKKRNKRFLESRRNARLVLPVHQRQQVHYRKGGSMYQQSYDQTSMIKMGGD